MREENEQDLSTTQINFLLGDVDGAFRAFMDSKAREMQAREEQGS